MASSFMSQFYVVGLILMACCLIIDILTVCTSIYQLYYQDGSIYVNKIFKFLTILTMILYTITAIGDFGQMIVRDKYYLNYHHYTLFGNYFMSIKDLFYYIGNFTFFLLLFMRIKLSFQVSKSVMCFIFSLLLISFSFQMAYCGVYLYFANDNDSQGNWVQYFDIGTYGSAVCDFIINIILFVLFIYKITHKETMEGMHISDVVAMK